ncbi:hypothetical protein J2T56_001091 [Natronobacillus azotifigens]|uniref:Uncharacterized protein n=1 Tax=Natronobacillus azotifigens TaxID=472978 RepID=A0A9J6RB25_9BACI|nr:hypothetical protein [Natronobacillus azotifigens]MCZ0702757.1 hypothetical protein [Natronobacillus azotifigens]
MSENILWDWMEEYIKNAISNEKEKNLSDLILLLLIQRQRRLDVEDRATMNNDEHISGDLEGRIDQIVFKQKQAFEALINQLSADSK